MALFYLLGNPSNICPRTKKLNMSSKTEDDLSTKTYNRKFEDIRYIFWTLKIHSHYFSMKKQEEEI